MGKDEYVPPPGPPPSHHSGGSWNPFRSSHTAAPQAQQASASSDAPPAYQAPPGPPPNWQGDKKQAPLGTGHKDYAPPPAPPPSHHAASEVEPPPYDPWMAVPDNALLPPPPSFHEETSPTANASYDDAKRGHAWCRQNPLWRPQAHNNITLQRGATGDISLTAPPHTKNITLQNAGKGRTHIRTSAKCGDTIFLSDVPLYTAYPPTQAHQLPRTVYFELKVLAMGTGEGDAGIALGLLAPPYPSWRLPGWHRASFGVHADDGRRYVDDSYGGKDFVQAFRKGETVGVGITFGPPVYAGGKNRIEVSFTRNGKKDGQWDLYEERDRDQEEGDVTGLEGQHDLLAAVGCFGSVEFETRFAHVDWLYRP